jgi:hypothetical protein
VSQVRHWLEELHFFFGMVVTDGAEAANMFSRSRKGSRYHWEDAELNPVASPGAGTRHQRPKLTLGSAGSGGQAKGSACVR